VDIFDACRGGPLDFIAKSENVPGSSRCSHHPSIKYAIKGAIKANARNVQQ